MVRSPSFIVCYICLFSMKHLLLTFLSCLFFTCNAFAGKNLVITFADGSTQTYLLSKNPNVSVADDKLIVAVEGAQTEYVLNKVKTFTFNEATGIEETIMSDVTVQRYRDKIVISGVNKVEAYNVSGQKVRVDYLYMNDAVVVDLGSLPQGVSVIKYNGGSFKFMKK